MKPDHLFVMPTTLAGKSRSDIVELFQEAAKEVEQGSSFDPFTRALYQRQVRELSQEYLEERGGDE